MVDGQRIGAGKFKPKGVEPGDYVTYDIVQNGNFKNLKPGSLSKTTPPAGVAAPATNGGGTATQTSTGYSSYSDRQEVISRQAALNSALAFVDILAKSDSLPLPASKKKDEKADILEQIVMEYTAKFYHASTTQTYELPESRDTGGGLAAAEVADTNWNE